MITDKDKIQADLNKVEIVTLKQKVEVLKEALKGIR